ncbi:hypothetical protein CDIK_0338 [Cucumispora dikerogammari]|nr:hypothetical protein CDIK_0338 [Cucumispora dikerogammari]
MNIFNFLYLPKISFSKHIHNHIVKAIPKDINPLKCYKYSHEGAREIPCGYVPKRKYNKKTGKKRLINRKVKYVYLPRKENTEEQIYVKKKLENIDNTEEKVSNSLLKIDKRLKKIEKNKLKASNTEESNSENFTNEKDKETKRRKKILQRFTKFKKLNPIAWKKFEKHFKKHKSIDGKEPNYGLNEMIMFMTAYDPETFNYKTKEKMPKRVKRNTCSELEGVDCDGNEFAEALKQNMVITNTKDSKQKSGNLSIDAIKENTVDMQEKFQDTIDGLMSHLGNSDLNDIFSQWGRVKKAEKKEKPVIHSENEVSYKPREHIKKKVSCTTSIYEDPKPSVIYETPKTMIQQQPLAQVLPVQTIPVQMVQVKPAPVQMVPPKTSMFQMTPIRFENNQQTEHLSPQLTQYSQPIPVPQNISSGIQNNQHTNEYPSFYTNYNSSIGTV